VLVNFTDRPVEVRLEGELEISSRGATKYGGVLAPDEAVLLR